MKKIVVLLAALGVAFTSCESDDSPNNEPKGEFESGILVSHEGSTVSGSVSFVSNDLETIENDIYNRVNGSDLGTFQQSIGFNGEEAFIVVDNANTVAVVNRFTFEEKAIISDGLVTPRYIAFSGNKAYVTNWGSTADETDDFIAIIDLDTDKVTGKIPVALGPERILVKGNKIYVSHKGAFGINNRVSVIDTADGNKVKEIETLFLPDEMVLIGDDLWVSCEGRPSWRAEGESIAGFTKINTVTDTIESTLEFSLGNHPGVLTYVDGTFYYNLGTSIYTFDNPDTGLPLNPLTSATAIYGMSVNDGKIYTVDAGDFTSAGKLNVFDIDSEEWGESISVGVVPAKIYFQ